MKAFLLARVSTDDQKDALPAQTHRLVEYAKRCGYEYELTELKESAYKGNRDFFKTVIDQIKTTKEQVVVVFDKIDRYTRDSSSEEVRTLQNLYRTGKIELHFPSDNLYIHKGSPATDLLRLGMGIVVAQYYSDAISDNVKRRFEQKLRDGEWIRQAPMGYKNTVTPEGKKWVEIDPLPAKAVKEAFELYASGNSSQREIARIWRESYGYQVGSSKIDQVLKNPFYYGEMRVGGKLYPHKYDPVVSYELFKAVENVGKGYKIKKHRWGGLPYAYRGLISCFTCGCKITFEKKKGKYIYGHCTQSKGKHDAPYILEDKLTSQLMNLFEAIQIPLSDYVAVSEALRSSHEDKKAASKALLSTLDTEITKYQRRIEKVYEDYLDEKIPEALYEKKFAEYREAQKKLQNKRQTFELVDDSYYGSVSHLLKLSRDAPKLFEKANNEQKRTMITTVLSNLVLEDDQLRWEYKKPFDAFEICAKGSLWLRLLGSNQRPNR